MYDIHVVFLDVHFFNLPHLYFFFFFYFFYLFFLFFFVVNQLCETTRTAKRTKTKTMPTTTTTTTTTITTGMEKTVRNRKRETCDDLSRVFFDKNTSGSIRRKPHAPCRKCVETIWWYLIIYCAFSPISFSPDLFIFVNDALVIFGFIDS